jgi:hypothetical protein
VYTVKSLDVRDVVRELRHGEVRVAYRISRALVTHAVKTTPVRLRYGTRRMLLRAAGRLA